MSKLKVFLLVITSSIFASGVTILATLQLNVADVNISNATSIIEEPFTSNMVISSDDMNAKMKALHILIKNNGCNTLNNSNRIYNQTVDYSFNITNNNCEEVVPNSLNGLTVTSSNYLLTDVASLAVNISGFGGTDFTISESFSSTSNSYRCLLEDASSSVSEVILESDASLANSCITLNNLYQSIAVVPVPASNLDQYAGEAYNIGTNQSIGNLNLQSIKDDPNFCVGSAVASPFQFSGGNECFINVNIIRDGSGQTCGVDADQIELFVFEDVTPVIYDITGTQCNQLATDLNQ